MESQRNERLHSTEFTWKLKHATKLNEKVWVFCRVPTMTAGKTAENARKTHNNKYFKPAFRLKEKIEGK